MHAQLLLRDRTATGMGTSSHAVCLPGNGAVLPLLGSQAFNIEAAYQACPGQWLERLQPVKLWTHTTLACTPEAAWRVHACRRPALHCVGRGGEDGAACGMRGFLHRHLSLGKRQRDCCSALCGAAAAQQAATACGAFLDLLTPLREYDSLCVHALDVVMSCFTGGGVA